MKKLLSTLLAAALLLTMLPQMALFSSAYEFTGACGENLTWILDADLGILTIKGTGKMDDYIKTENGSSAPWFENDGFYNKCWGQAMNPDPKIIIKG